MLNVVAFVQLVGAFIAVDAQDARCPSALQVRAALDGRIPGAVAELPPARPTQLYRLRLRDIQAGSVLQLFDGENRLALERTLPAAGPESNCPALAETVAIIVERYLVELNMAPLAAEVAKDKPEVSPPGGPRPATWQLGTQARWKSGRVGAGAWGGELMAGRDFGRERDWNVELALGAALPADLTWADPQQGQVGQGRTLSASLLVATGRRWQAGQHRWLLRASAGLAAVQASRTAPAPSLKSWGFEPWMGPEAVYRWMFPRTPSLGATTFLQVALAGRMALVRHQLVLTGPDDKQARILNETPRVFADIGIGAGIEF